MSKECPHCKGIISHLDVKKWISGIKKLKDSQGEHPVEYELPKDRMEPDTYACPACGEEIGKGTLARWEEWEEVKPKPGDVVQVFNPEDTLIKDGSYGVIQSRGAIGIENGIAVCFNAYSTFKEESTVSSSGGLEWNVPVKALEPTDEKRGWLFWRWKKGELPRAGGGEDYEEVVRVWKLDRSKMYSEQGVL